MTAAKPALEEFAQSTLPTLEGNLSMVQELSRPGVAGKQAPKGAGGGAMEPPAGSGKGGKK